MRFYKLLLKFIPIAVLTVVLPRVASFVYGLGSGGVVHWIISAAFAILLGLGVIGTSYFSDFADIPEYDDDVNPRSKEGKRRERELAYYTAMLQAAPYAQTAMYVFAFLDGMFNLADALLGASRNGLFEGPSPWLNAVYYAATLTYGVAPTVLSIMLSRLASLVDRIPDGYERAHKDEIDIVRTIMGNLGWTEFGAGDKAELGYDENVVRSGFGNPNLTRTSRGPSKSRLVYDYLDVYATDGNMPTLEELMAYAADQGVNIGKSTASEARTRWMRANNGHNS